jgi:hypothetical protein
MNIWQIEQARLEPRYRAPSPIAPWPGKHTNKEYQSQGRNAFLQGYAIESCPYYETSTAWENWRKGYKSV